MRALHLIARDLADMAEMNKALAEDLQELSVFFGGAAVLPAPAPPRQPQPTAQLPQPVVPRPAPPPPIIPPAQPPSQAALPGEVTFTRRDGQTVTRKKANKEPSRHLSPEEKDRIRADWNSLPENLRNPTNRAAIAAKFQCSRAQVFALTRADLHQHLMAAQAAKLRKAEERQAARQS